jgi:hypothetical protein
LLSLLTLRLLWRGLLRRRCGDVPLRADVPAAAQAPRFRVGRGDDAAQSQDYSRK